MYINGQKLENDSQAKYLGVILGKKLPWQQHINKLKGKINKVIGIFRKLRVFVQENVLRNIFNAFFKPYFQYENLAWGGAAITQLIESSYK